MPSFENSHSHSRDAGSLNSYSYDKILAIYNEKGDNSAASRSSRVHIAFKDQLAYDDFIKSTDDTTYNRVAGSDLSNIFMPFQTKIGVSGSLPSFHSSVSTTPTLPSGGQTLNIHHVLPFMWEPTSSGYIYDRWTAASGDSLRSLVSAEKLYGEIEEFRDVSNIRGIGLRLPLMGIGWGFTLDEDYPWPSGSVSNPGSYPSGSKFFKGGVQKGWQLDPSDYIAAPIDFRYDKARNVWTCGGRGLPPGQGRYKVLMITDDASPVGSVGWDYPRFH